MVVFSLSSNSFFVCRGSKNTVEVWENSNTTNAIISISHYKYVCEVGNQEVYDALEIFGTKIRGDKLERLARVIRNSCVEVNREGLCFLFVGTKAINKGLGTIGYRLNDIFDWSLYGVKSQITTVWNRRGLPTDVTVVDYEDEKKSLKNQLSICKEQSQKNEKMLQEAVNKLSVAECELKSAKSKIVALQTNLDKANEKEKELGYEINNLKGQLSNCTQQLQEMVKTQQEAQKKICCYEFKLKCVKDELASIKRASEAEIAALKENLDKANKKEEELKNEITNLKNQLSNCTQEMEKTQQEAQKKIFCYEFKLKSVKDELASIKRASEAEIAALKENLDKANKKEEGLKFEITNLKNQLSNCTQEMEKTQQEAQKKIFCYEFKLKSVKDELASIKRASEAEIAALKENLDKANKKEEELKYEMPNLKNQLSNCKQQSQEKEYEINNLKKQLSSCKQRSQEMEKELQEAMMKLSDAKSELKCIKSELVSVQEDFKVEIADLQKHLNYLVDKANELQKKSLEKKEELENEINKLKNRHSSRITNIYEKVKDMLTRSSKA